jgi:hypothetical protein
VDERRLRLGISEGKSYSAVEDSEHSRHRPGRHITRLIPHDKTGRKSEEAKGLWGVQVSLRAPRF